MKIEVICPLCKGAIVENKSSLHCTLCQSSYFKDEMLEIYDFTENISVPDPSDTAIDLKELYAIAADLETRIKFFNTRFFHDLNVEKLFKLVNSVKKTVLELGCGTMKPLLPVGAAYLPTQTVVGIDISKALLSRALKNSPNAKLYRANAAFLPFPDNTFDLIWARHMLYHTENPKDVIAETARVLSDEGIIFTSTNSVHNKEQMHEFHHRLIAKLNIDSPPPKRASFRFSAETGNELLASEFKFVKTIAYKGKFVFKDTEEALRYYFSTAYYKWIQKTTSMPMHELERFAVELYQQDPIHELNNSGAIILATNSEHEYQSIIETL